MLSHINYLHKLLLLFSCLLLHFVPAKAQKATIREESNMIKTYPFSDPDPVPVLTTNPKIYPYHTFEGYSHTGKPQAWKVVRMENAYIRLFVLPEAGGKVWGAIEKSTGKEFIYRNEVMKFRNIAMRGPWTSGGIEFNFGLIGHTPTTATPVDYVIQENPDGSVSCIVGAMDLPSRTQWRVKITLPADKAYFETQSLWYNPTPVDHPYYNWMTGAARAGQDLELFYPGDAYLGHPGDVHPWPVDQEGRNLAFYRNNNFGGSKSYHVVGNYHDFFGGYWHDADFGFGHWAPYVDMPGQKLWIWSLSRSGGIWEDLLTDTDGQYIEFQAGRLFNQFSYSESHDNPVSEVAFAPYTTDQWRELWFPVKELGGLSAVSPLGAVHVTAKDDKMTFSFNAFQKTADTLVIKAADSILYQASMNLNPMDVYTKTVPLPADAGDIRITLGKALIYAASQKQTHALQRPFKRTHPLKRTPAGQLFVEGKELAKGRKYIEAMQKFEACLQQEPAHQQARIALAELYYRNGQYSQALEQAKRALEADTYDFDANYVAGITYNALGDRVNALEALGWAARSMEYRSAAYAQMAEIAMQTQDYAQANLYAQRSLDYNRFNISASQVLAVLYRKTGDTTAARETLTQLLTLDPLHHFARFEQYLLDPKPQHLEQFSSMIRNELPYQTYLELAMDYRNMGQQEDAVAVLRHCPSHPLADLWLAYLTRSDTAASEQYLSHAMQPSPAFVFPYRRETIQALEWAVQKQHDWKLQYYLGLNYWGKNRPEEAAALFKACGNVPDYAPFYLARADLLEKTEGKDKAADLQKALSLDEGQWRSWHQWLHYLEQHQQDEKEMTTASRAYQKFADSYIIGMDYAHALLNSGQYEQCIQILQKLQVLPYEGASEGRVIFEQAYLGSALEQLQQGRYQAAVKTLQTSLDWPENLGVGKPYDPDTRRQEYLLAYCFQKLHKSREAKQHVQNIIDYTEENSTYPQVDDLLSLKALDREGKKEDIASLLHSLENAQTPAAQWVLAYWQQKESAMQKVQEQLAGHKDFILFHQLLEATADF